MKGKWKKATSVAVTSAIIAAQALMQVSAAGGKIDAEMSTKSPVLRVVVPTTMAVSVNEFEMGDEGSQVTSAAFTMQNVSEIPVNVKVTSTAELGADIAPVSTRKAAEDSTDTAKPAMWLAAVAAVADNSGLEYATGSDTTIKGITGSEDNATAFGGKDENNKSTAVQNFYLKEATAAQYKAIVGGDIEDIGEGADFYKLTEISGLTDDASATAAAADKDIYVIQDGTAASAGSSVAIAKVAKGSTLADGSDWTDNTSKAYTLADTPTAYATAQADSTGSYLYIDAATAATGDSAAFRYAGALSTAKSGWSDTNDLKGIEINYDITGISTSVYTDLASDLTYGFKAEDSRITITASGLMTIQGLTGATYSGGVLTLEGTEYEIGRSAGSWVETETAPATYQFSENWTNQIKGKSVKVEITLTDNTKITETVAVPAA